MKKKKFAFLLGIMLMAVSFFGLFPEINVRASVGPIEQNYDFAQGLPEDLMCDLMGKDCLDTVVIGGDL